MNNAKIPTPVKAIRAKCLECSNGNPKEVALCHLERCPLYPYRHGKNPNRRGTLRTEEQRAAARERMKRLHEQQRASGTPTALRNGL